MSVNHSTTPISPQFECAEYIARVAWMAGFIDGDGYITISGQVRKNRPTRSYRVYVGVSNTKREALELFVQYYGGAIYHVHESRKGIDEKNWADAYNWYCPISSSKRLLEDVLPYLKIKTRQAALCLEFLRERKNTKQWRRANGQIGGSIGLDAEELRKREAYRVAIQSLNAKGKLGRAAR